MRILFLSIEYPPESPNGIGSYVVEMAAALGRRGHEVHVLSCIPGQERRDYRDGEVWVHRRGEPRLRGHGRLAPGPRTAARIRHAWACWREARALGLWFDIVESPDWMAEGLLFAVRRRPLVAHLHTPLEVISRYSGRPRTRDVRTAAVLERMMVSRAALVTSPSALLVEKLARAGWLKEQSAKIIRLPIAESGWKMDVDVRLTRPVVLYAGRLEPLKAPEVLVEAATQLARELPDLEVLFAGASSGSRDGRPYGDWLADRIAESGAPCRLLGQVPRLEIARLAGSARVFALPSHYENLPFAGLEAMASGRPVVCTTNTGLAELLTDSGAGIAVPPDDPEALADALRTYLSDPLAAAAAGERGRELVRVQCSPDLIAEERERCYVGVATSRRSPR